MQVDAHVQLANAQVDDVLHIAGVQQNYPVTGVLSLNLHAAGPLKTLSGGGNLALANGVAYGEPYQSFKVALAVQGRDDFEATSAQLQLHNMLVTANGGYDLIEQALPRAPPGKSFGPCRSSRRCKGRTLRSTEASASLRTRTAPCEQPGVTAKLTLANVLAGGQPIGDLSADLHSTGSLLSLNGAIHDGRRADSA